MSDMATNGSQHQELRDQALARIEHLHQIALGYKADRDRVINAAQAVLDSALSERHDNKPRTQVDLAALDDLSVVLGAFDESTS